MKLALPSTPTVHFDTIHSNLSVSSPSNLPLCSSESCLAFPAGRTASQAPIPGADQLGYGRWISYYYSAILFIFSLIYWMQRIRNRARQCSTQKTTPAQNLLALWRCWSYRRPAGRVGATLRMSYSMLSLLLLSLLITILLAFVQRPYYRPPVGEGPPPLGVRAGLMAVALMPPIVALSGKFNIVTLLTGISHERLNVLHRWVAYICMGLALVHALPFILVPLWDGGQAGLKEEYYQHGSSGYTGTPVISLLFFITLFSIRPLRRRFYETFVHSHILASIVFLVLLFWHSSDTLHSWDYLWATVAVWALSLIGRLVFKMRIASMGGIRGVETSVEELDGGGMLRVSVDTRGKWAGEGMRWSPGQHLFLRWPKIGIVDNHPFTIASVRDEAARLDEKGGGAPSTRLRFLIKPHHGVTKKLAKHACIHGQSKPLRAFIDGPYGGVNRPLEFLYESVILVAGGGGITAVLPWLVHLSRKMGTEGCVTREVRLVWTVKHRHALEWVAEDLREAIDVAPAGSVGIEYYVTVEGEGSELDVDSSHQLKKQQIRKISEARSDVIEVAAAIALEDDRKFSRRYTCDTVDIEAAMDMARTEKIVRVHTREFEFGPGLFGRPVLETLIPEMVRLERTIVVGCGPESLKIDLSNTVARCQKTVLKGEVREVALHTETFGW